MNEDKPAQRRRGGQPGNHNAKGNRGNSNPRRNIGNRGGRGAPCANQYARKRARGLQATLLAEYQDNNEARQWIEANRDALANLIDDEPGVDAVDIAIHQRINPEDIARRGKEFEFGLFIKPDINEFETTLAA